MHTLCIGLCEWGEWIPMHRALWTYAYPMHWSMHGVEKNPDLCYEPRPGCATYWGVEGTVLHAPTLLSAPLGCAPAQAGVCYLLGCRGHCFARPDIVFCALGLRPTFASNAGAYKCVCNAQNRTQRQCSQRAVFL
eukprot:15464467-Alexandrium_andersonii.AAC.1